MKRLIYWLYPIALLTIGTLLLINSNTGCVTSGGSTTQPALDAGSLVTLAITDYEALVASGVIKETPELDAAITAVFAAQKAYADGKGDVGALNAAGMQLALALSKARK
jgi:hypothetical protein